MSSAEETFTDRQQVQEFIAAEPAVIALNRKPRVSTAAGGYTEGDETTLDPQQFRLVPFKRRLTHGAASGSGGEGRVASLPYVLVGAHDADVQIGDYFSYNGLDYEVLSIEPNRRVRTAAELVETGAST